MWALVPVKKFTEGKQRLASLLTGHERRSLSQAMVEDVVQCLSNHPKITQVVLVSGDPRVGEIAAAYGGHCWTEAALNARGLNAITNAVARRLTAQGVGELMVVHGDLPLLNTKVLTQLIERHRQQQRPAMTIVPDRHGEGSNIVVSSPPTAVNFHFGPRSYRQHQAEASAREVTVETFFCREMGSDMDTPEDLRVLVSRDIPGNRSLQYLWESGIARRLKFATTESVAAVNRQEIR